MFFQNRTILSQYLKIWRNLKCIMSWVKFCPHSLLPWSRLPCIDLPWKPEMCRVTASHSLALIHLNYFEFLSLAYFYSIFFLRNLSPSSYGPFNELQHQESVQVVWKEVPNKLSSSQKIIIEALQNGYANIGSILLVSLIAEVGTLK